MKFGKKLIVYAIGNVASKLVSIALLPIYTRNIVASDFGRADIAQSSVTLVVSIIFIEIWTGLLRFLFEAKENKDLKEKIFSNVIFISAILTIPYFIVQTIANVLLGTGFTVISFIYGISFLTNQNYQFMARGNGKTQMFLYSGMVASVIQILVGIIAIYFFQIGAAIILLAPIVGYICSTLYLEYMCQFSRYFNFKMIEKSYIKKLIKFSAPLAINSAAFWVISNFNRYYVAYSMGFEYSSYVAIASKFTMVVSLAASIYSMAWQESAYENSNDKNRNLYYSEMFKIYLLISTILTGLCIIVTKFIFPLMIGEEYHGAIVLLVPYYIATHISGLSNFLAQIFNAEKRTGYLMLSTLSGSLANIISMFTLAPMMGIIAAPISLVLGYLVNIVIRFINIKKIVNVEFDKNAIIRSIILIAFSSISFIFTKNIIMLIFSTIIFVLLATFLFYDMIKKFIKSICAIF